LLRGGRLTRWTEQHWLHAVGKEALHHARRLLFWLTLATMFVIAGAGIVYHLAGRDLRDDLGLWYENLTVEQLVQIGVHAAALVGVAAATCLLAWLVRRLRPHCHAHANRVVGRAGNQEHLARWFKLLERYAITVVRLSGIWVAGQIVGLGHLADVTVGFVLSVLTILVVARLLTLACRTLTHTLADFGDHHLGSGQLAHYWERIRRLFPFGERCFEAAVYVWAASLCVEEMHFIQTVAQFGPRIVQCIGILFGTRVLIELLQVLLNEAFGMYKLTDEEADAKGRTLVPLLHSGCQYVLYFGSAVVMLGVLGLDTRPILAGAGILGLAVGLGAQSLVTDVVSGFFILFENQYLVGDYVQIGDAVGTVEAVGIRVTQVRDGHGKLYIIPNGQIKTVVNYSKGYINAVVDVRVPSGSDLEGVFRAMTEAGHRLRQTHKQVLGDTQIHGVVELGTSEMTVRAVTKVMPGTHGAMQNEYRRLLKIVFDESHGPATPRIAA
jgi:small conductance mechanosensitive channel